jgi:hypothetical protein
MKSIFILNSFIILTGNICLAQNIGIGTTTPGFPLNFATTLGDKISLFGNTGNHYGFGVQSGLLQIHSDAAAANIAFGFGSSGAFNERARINNSGLEGMYLNGRLHLRNGDPANAGGGGGVWLYNTNNTAQIGFMGTQNNQNIGFFGGPGLWGFTYDVINSRVGIGTSNPTSSLNVNGQITVDQKNFGGYGGLLLKGNIPGSNYPNIAFTINNNASPSADVVAAMIQGDLVNSAAGAETIDLTFLTSKTGLGGLSERLRIKNNGNVGIGNANPNAPLSFAPSLGKKITLYPGTLGDAGFGMAGNRLQIYADNLNADVAIGYDAAGVFNERFAFKPTGALALSGSTGTAGQYLRSNGSGAATWGTPAKPNVSIFNQTGNTSFNSNLLEVEINGLNGVFFISSPSTVVFGGNLNIVSANAIATSYGYVEIRIIEGLNNVVATARSTGSMDPLRKTSLHPTGAVVLQPGTYAMKAFFGRLNVPDLPSLSFVEAPSKVWVQVIPD